MTHNLAALLWQARTSGGHVPPEAAAALDSIEAAYRVQDGIEALSGMPRCGWKVGATSKVARQLLDAPGPVTAPMFKPFCFQSPAKVAVFMDHNASVESEFAFRFARDLPPRRKPYSLEEVLDAVDALLPAIEIVGGRFRGGLPGIGPYRLIADMAIHTAFVSGQETARWQGIDLTSHSVSLFKNGKLEATGIGADVLGGPSLVLQGVANHLSGRSESILAGQIVTTGTCTGITPVSHGDNFTADFGTLGSVRVRIVGAQGESISQ